MGLTAWSRAQWLELALLAIGMVLVVFMFINGDDVLVHEEEILNTLLENPLKFDGERMFFIQSNSTNNTVNVTEPSPSPPASEVFDTDQVIGATQDITVPTTYNRYVTMALPGTSTYNADVLFGSGSTLQVTATRIFQGSGAITFAPGARVIFSALVTFIGTGPLSFLGNSISLDSFGAIFAAASLAVTNSNFDLTNNATAQFQSTLCDVTSSTLSGSGVSYVNAVGAALKSTGNVWSIVMQVATTGFGTRRTSFGSTSSVTWCSTASAGIVVASGTAVVVDTGCTLSTNTSYSSSATSAVWSSGSYVVFDNVTTASKPLYSDSLSMDNTKLEVITTITRPTTVVLAQYTPVSSCVQSWQSTTVDGCPGGFSCTVTGRAMPNTPTPCEIILTIGTPPESNDSNSALYGLFALLAIPIILAIVCYCVQASKRHSATAGMAELQPYPVVEMGQDNTNNSPAP